jgi:hypothetical protein
MRYYNSDPSNLIEKGDKNRKNNCGELSVFLNMDLEKVCNHLRLHFDREGDKIALGMTKESLMEWDDDRLEKIGGLF